MAVKKKITKRTTETWKKKEWFTIVAPKVFDEKEVGNTPVLKPENLIDRIIKVPLREITGNMSHQFVKLWFRIVETKGKKAYTKVDGYELTREYLRRNVRRRKSMIRTIMDLKTNDEQKVRITAYVFTRSKIDTSQKDVIRKIMSETLERVSKSVSLDQFIQKCVYGNLSSDIFKDVKKVSPVRRVEVNKCVVLRR